MTEDRKRRLNASVIAFINRESDRQQEERKSCICKSGSVTA
jgi:hypothetical protein